MPTSPIYPGHELMYDDPVGSVVELHAPGFVGTSVQRAAFNTTGLTRSKQWFETDTGKTYQWSGSAWGLLLGAPAAGTSGQLLIWGTGNSPAFQTVGGDGTLSSSGALVISTLGGNPVSKTVPNVVLNGLAYNTSGQTITSITLSGTNATVTQTSHGYNSGDTVVIKNATGQTGVNAIWFPITVTDPNTYTFQTTLTGTVTGSPVVSFWFRGTSSLGQGKISNITYNGVGDYSGNFTNLQPNTNYGIKAAGGNVGRSTYFSMSNNANTTSAFDVQFFTAGSTIPSEADYYLLIELTGII